MSRQGAARAATARATTFATPRSAAWSLLEKGEAADSERVNAAIGPNVMASVYYFYDTVHERGIEPAALPAAHLAAYCALVEEIPRRHRHFRTHEGHYTDLHPARRS